MVDLACTVRGCGEPLSARGAQLGCPRGHAFDVARSGYVNLLQPQDKRSLAPGDPREATLARRRLHDAGANATLIAGLAALLAGLELAPGARAADLGSGEGSLFAELAARFALDACGV